MVIELCLLPLCSKLQKRLEIRTFEATAISGSDQDPPVLMLAEPDSSALLSMLRDHTGAISQNEVEVH